MPGVGWKLGPSSTFRPVQNTSRLAFVNCAGHNWQNHAMPTSWFGHDQWGLSHTEALQTPKKCIRGELLSTKYTANMRERERERETILAEAGFY